MSVKNIAIVSLSSGIIGEDIVQHEVSLGLKRLAKYNVNVKFMPHSRMGLDYLRENPGSRAEDLIEAFLDDEIDMILCAIGGDDTYRLLPYLFENNELEKAVNRTSKNKIFLGFSDTTMNHLMLHKVGMKTFYGQAFLSDICELSEEMLPYTRRYFDELIRTGRISRIEPSDVWYSERAEWDESQIGVSMPEHANNGFELLQGASRFEGKILGGCIDSIYDIFNSDRYPDTVELCNKYNLFPEAEKWKGYILLLETSEEKPEPELYRKMLNVLKERGIFEAVSGILIGKPQNETYFDDYKEIITEVVDNSMLPIVANINVGHATPRCIIPMGVPAIVDIENQCISFT